MPKNVISVPLSSRKVPYRLEADGAGRYVRIRRPGPDLIVLVPPGMNADDHETALRDAMRGAVTTRIKDRRFDLLLKILTFVVVPLVLVACIAVSNSRAVLTALPYIALSLQIAFLVALVAYVVYLLLPAYGGIASLTSVNYPADPETLMRRLRDDSGFRYLTDRTFVGSRQLTSLRRGVIDFPQDVDDATWANLWVLAGGGELYPSAALALDDAAARYERQSVDRFGSDFQAELDSALDDFDYVAPSEPIVAPVSPDSPVEIEVDEVSVEAVESPSGDPSVLAPSHRGEPRD